MYIISSEKANKLIEPYIVEKIQNKNCEVQTKKAISFLTCCRFDLAAKLLFLEDIKNNRDINSDIYNEHIRLITLGSYTEPGNDSKNSLEKFKLVFKKLYSDIKNKGFDDSISLIPYCNDGSILNGAHRVACAIDLKKEVKAIHVDIPPQQLDYRFFKKRGASSVFMDRCATEFIKQSPNTYIAIIWPIAEGYTKEIETILGNIVYCKELLLSFKGLHNFVSEIYQDEEWLGDIKKNYPGAIGKVLPCFKKGNLTRIYAFQSVSPEEVLIKKQQIRDLFNIDKHSIHISDSSDQSLDIAHLVFNKNSEHFLNYGNPSKYLETLDKFDSFLGFCKKNGIDKESIVLDGGIVLALYGLRKCNDVDYIVDDLKNLTLKNSESHEINSHNEETIYHGFSSASLVHDSSYHFRYRGIKVLAIEQIIKMKENRKEAKDLIDLDLMKELHNQYSLKFVFNKFKNKLFFIKAQSLQITMKLLVFFHLYNLVRFFYRRLKMNE